MRAPISDHHLVLYIGSGGTVEWHICNVVSRMGAPISDFQYCSWDLVDKECHIHTVLASNCMIGEGTSNMKGCIESKYTVNTVVSALLSLLDNTD